LPSDDVPQGDDVKVVDPRSRRLVHRLTLRWWSLQNWLKGYKFGWVQRYRCCDHTTPYHYRTCVNHPAQKGATKPRPEPPSTLHQYDGHDSP
jgi:hypothetical protein